MQSGRSLSMPTYVSGFKSVLPRFSHSQQDAFSWLEAAHLQAELTRRRLATPALPEDHAPEGTMEAFQRALSAGLRRFGCSPPRITRRMTDLEDFSHTMWPEMRVFRLHEQASGAALGRRMALFGEAADRALCALYPGASKAAQVTEHTDGIVRESEEPPSFLIHVSCTGYVSPNPTQRLISLRGWHASTESHQAYHMGCYAAIPALRTASMAVESGRYRSADVVHTEVCTLHFDPSLHHPEQLVVQSLFADGHIAYQTSQQRPGPAGGFRLLNVLEGVIPDSLGHMTWVPGEHALTMTLSRDVPQLVAKHVRGFVDRLCSGAGLDARSVLRGGLAALHPGGPRIIDGLQDVLELENEQVRASREILRDRGNMSSATLPHILQQILREPHSAASDTVLGLAFGPGLTMAGVLLERC